MLELLKSSVYRRPRAADNLSGLEPLA